MGYSLQIAAMLALTFGFWLFNTGGTNPDLTWGQFMTSLAFIAATSISLFLVGLRKVRLPRASYWWLSSVVFLFGAILLVGIYASYTSGAEGADIGGILLMLLGAFGLAVAELIALLWSVGVDVAGRIKSLRGVAA
ncbi:MAG: hypothetical protein Q4P23_06395 [Micrococcaceae bacterium]|nr:hypothetical protein [Micrococcaceae bacterium]